MSLHDLKENDTVGARTVPTKDIHGMFTTTKKEQAGMATN
jgi:hypothetical protein